MKIEDIFALDELPLKDELYGHLKKTYENIISENGFLYAEGEIPVLLIAHLDTVHKDLAPPICWSKDNRFIMSPNGIGGDDRCGIYMILELIKEFKCHVLFCEQEEKGCVGAKDFCKSGIKPDVNYIIEFDRKGHDDSVFYDCDNEEFEKFINSVGFKTSWGSCSDISQIAPHLGIAAVNLSSGYYNAHTLYEFVDMHYVNRNVERAKELLKKDFATKHLYIKKTYAYQKYGYQKNDYNYNQNKKNVEKNAAVNKQTNKKQDGAVRKISIVSLLLMKLESDEYWVWGKEWADCVSDANYYIDNNSNLYIEICNIFEEMKCTQVLSKETLLPPEFIRSKAKLYDINLISDKQCVIGDDYYVGKYQQFYW